MDTRQMGVEEEMFLVDPATRRLVGVSDEVVRAAEPQGRAEDLDQELFLQQIETSTEPHVDPAPLLDDLRAQRRTAAEAAGAAGAVVAAVATPVLADDDVLVTPKERYHRMMSGFGAVGRGALVCATHVHVEVADEDAVGVIDDVRHWLPLVLAVSVNSPFDHGVDTGYASWRGQVWDAWPSAGPVEPFGDLAGYREAVSTLIASGAALDEAMVYLDVRVARSYPTVEIRIADVCTDLDDTVLVAELSRALVETAVRDRAAGVQVPAWRVEQLRAARWRARRDGLTDSLLDPRSRTLVRAEDALQTLRDHLAPVLDEHGTADLVDTAFQRLLTSGTGADRQRAVAASRGLDGVVDDLVSRTRAAWDGGQS